MSYQLSFLSANMMPTVHRTFVDAFSDYALDMSYLTEEKLYALAEDLGEDPDVMLALSGKISKDIQNIIRKRPQLFAQLIRELKDLPDHSVLRIVREVRDGNW